VTRLPGRMRRLIALAAVAVLVMGTATACSKKEVLPKREGLPVKIGGLDYTVFITRELNPRDVEDRDYIPQADPGTGFAYFGVFIQVCNTGHSAPTRTPVNDFKIVDTQGNTYSPSPLPTTDIFAYRPRPLAARQCIPVAGSTAAGAPTGGSLLLFKLPVTAIENRPMDLEIAPPATGVSPKRERIELDI
jgi:hypothetical protein